MEYPYPPERVWAALTSSEALAAWLMPNDFVPEVGHGFTLRTKPAPSFHGLGGQLTRRILAGGYPRLLGQRLPAWLDQQAALRLAGGPATVRCAEGWRGYLGIVRRWRDAANS